jgi:hypothetical protein
MTTKRGWTMAAALQAAIALLMVAAAAPAAAQIVLYEHDRFGGRTVSIDDQADDLGNSGFNDMASSIVVRGGRWEVCADAHFNGQCVTLKPGRYASLSEMGMNDQVSSVRRVRGRGGANAGGYGGNAPIELFEDDEFRGRAYGAEGVVPSLSSADFNDRASSVIVRSGRWQLCTDDNFRGRCVTLDPGSYRSLSEFGLNDAVSSMRPAGGYSRR